RPSGSDLILRELATGTEMNIGNVSEFAFDKAGRRLAIVIDAAGQAGNGVQLRDLKTGVQISLENGKARYRSLKWNREGTALSLLKGVTDKAYAGKQYSVIGFTNFDAPRPKKTVYDPRNDKQFPAGMTISPNRNPSWTDNRDALVFGIHELKKKPAASKKKPAKKKATARKRGKKKPAGELGDPFQAPKRAQSPSSSASKPDLVIWHWKDKRLQSRQQVQASRDKSFSYLCLYRVKDKKFVRLADDDLRLVSLAPKQRWAVGYDDRNYQLAGSLSGRRFRDVYVVDAKTGNRRIALKKHRWSFTPDPTGKRALYYSDGQYYVYELATGKSANITANVPTSFVNTEDDHNIAMRPIRPVGWVKGGGSVLLYDNWDVWNVPVNGGKAVNLTIDGRKTGVRYNRRLVLDREKERDGIDLSGRVCFSVYGEWTKKAGYAAIQGGKPGAKRLQWGDALYSSIIKAKKANVFLYTRQTFTSPPDYYVCGPSLSKGKRITDVNRGQNKFRWSSGCRLVDYKSAQGKKLQAALFLPADYQPNKRYPTIVYIYERLSSRLHRYAAPSARGFNPSVYTSNGYAVLMPDISYTINDPGRSAVWCVLPALEAAIGTGVVDRDRVGLHGHSWGGYQTAFLITQTKVFKAAVAGAPLTNLISMYSSIYWNSGRANQPIFESSQGRFTQGYWENVDAYTRNSPVYFAHKVQTPLLLLHNDRDGAVDWNQGIEYFNTLRRQGKPVVMLQYKGENHGLSKPANQKDYTVRMREFFNHHLKDKPAPDWLKNGVPHLKMEGHIKGRLKGNNGK
ncbi:MAG: alpha/beta hydrolase family protein, partial [Planctomycetaceae bacterium]